jgi:hypothetical protein
MRIILTESQLNKLVNEQLTHPETELTKYLGDFDKIQITGDTHELGLENFTTPEDFVKKIKELFLVRLHPNAEEENYELISIPILSREINDLFKRRKKELIEETNTNTIEETI